MLLYLFESIIHFLKIHHVLLNYPTKTSFEKEGLVIDTNSIVLNSMALTAVSEKDIKKAIISSFKYKKTSDVEGISIWFLKQCSQGLIEPLVTVVNASFSEGVFPELCKVAKIIPIYKK